MVLSAEQKGLQSFRYEMSLNNIWTAGLNSKLFHRIFPKMSSTKIA